MQKPGHDNKRKFERYKLVLPVAYINLSSGKEGKAQMLDISDKGIRLISGENLSVGTSLDIWLCLPNGGRLYIKGEVAWSKSLEPGEHSIGVRLAEEELIKAMGVVERAIGNKPV